MKQKLLYICSVCSHSEPKWLGRCPECGNWNTFRQSQFNNKINIKGTKQHTAPIPLVAVETKEELRFDSGFAEMNRVLGGGIMKGSSVLLGGEPGIGKSTLMLQLASAIKAKGRVLYISGEESAAQLKKHAERVNISSQQIEVLIETGMSAILTALDELKPILVIIDSIQSLHNSEIGLIAGTVNQIKFCSQELIDWAKTRNAALFLVGHVTKEGIIAGPKVIEHMVDTVLSLEAADNDIRLLRAIKNRFGSIEEIGIFRMTDEGLSQLTDPASLFLEERDGEWPPGIAVTPIYEGSRVLLVEIQSLVVPAKGGISRVFSDRIDSRMVSKAAAVLEKHCNIQFANYDIYVNVAGGIQIREVGIELPLSLALYSARLNIPLPKNSIVLGEISLAGEIRKIKQIEKRLKTALELGYKNVYGPIIKDDNKPSGLKLYELATIQDTVKTVFTL